MKIKNYLATIFVVLISFLIVSYISTSIADLEPTTYFILNDLETNNPWSEIDNGTKINLMANQQYQLRTKSGNHIRFQAQETVQLRVNETAKNPVDCLPPQTRAVNRYMHMELNRTTLMNATMFRNYTNHELNGLGNVYTFRWAFFNEETFRWQYTHQNWIEATPDGATVFCNTTHFSVWTILTDGNPVPGTPYTPNNGTGFAIQAGNTYRIKTKSGFELQLKLEQGAMVNITEYSQSPKAMNQNRYQIRTQTMAIEMNTSAPVQANMSYTFTNQIKNQLGVKNMEKLKFMYYDEATDEWTAPKYQWLVEDTLYCNTTHFSLWTISEDVSNDSTPGFEVFPVLLSLVLSITILYKKKKN
ncbi:MAG: Heimdall-CTERM domain-containing surface protein [Candidatus Hodarchaeota archaeon]